MLPKRETITFTNWLLKQDNRSDEIGWLARLLKSPEGKSALAEIKGIKTASISHYIAEMPKSKIREALFHAVQEHIAGIAGAPKIGIFWIIEGEIVEFHVDAATVKPYMGFRDSPLTHLETWPQVQKMWKVTRGRDYETFPRGRVIGVGPDRFRLFLSPIDAKNKVQVRQIMSVFNLPFDKTEVMTDAHYVTQPQMGDWDTDASDKWEAQEDYGRHGDFEDLQI
jgi:hypothetical protein